jgi:methylated-DNA-[protein]-cysteine S-methyltransferase
MTIYTCSIETPLGPVTAAAEDGALTGLWFAGQKYFPSGTDSWTGKPEQPVFAVLRSWLGAYFEGKNPPIAFPLNPHGSAFQKSVWEILLQIPYGEVTTYGKIAKQLSCKSAQAVGGAVGHNPVSLVIPCHRVVGANGHLTGYAGGIDKKEYLLKLEGYRL